MKTNDILHYPRLDTVLMVEEFIRKNSGQYTRTQVWRQLPKRAMYQTFLVILDYLVSSSKVSTDSKGKIGWIYNPKLVQKFLKQGVVTR